MSVDGFNWILTLKDYLTRFTLPFAFKDKEAMSFVRAHLS